LALVVRIPVIVSIFVFMLILFVVVVVVVVISFLLLLRVPRGTLQWQRRHRAQPPYQSPHRRRIRRAQITIGGIWTDA
jgi:uncharacterized protein HemY